MSRPETRSRGHRWLERGVAFGGAIWWLVTTYLGMLFVAALLTSFTLMSEIRIFAELALVLMAFAAIAAHRCQPRLARVAHWGMIGAVAVVIGSCTEMVETPPRYVSVEYMGVQIEYADDDRVVDDLPQVRDIIAQVYARSGLAQPATPVRMRFVKNTGGRPFRVGDWSDAGEGGADVALTTNRGHTRGESFLLEGSFLLTEALLRRAHPAISHGAGDGFAYWTMIGISPQPEWAARYVSGEPRWSCRGVDGLARPLAPLHELTIWIPAPQAFLHVASMPFIDEERRGGAAAARHLLVEALPLSGADWVMLARQHCVP